MSNKASLKSFKQGKIAEEIFGKVFFGNKQDDLHYFI